MEFWQSLHNKIVAGDQVALMYVVKSEGSSPGREGFKMYISSSGEMMGSIGGGMMEHKLVEWCKHKLLSGRFVPCLKHQVHQSNIGEDRSGMICSGEQTIAFYYLDKDELQVLSGFLESESPTFLRLTSSGMKVINADLPTKKIAEDVPDWCYDVKPLDQPFVYIIGGGHVGLALSRVMKWLNFNVMVLDNRKELNTMKANSFADECVVIDYNLVGEYVSDGAYVVLVSFGYRTDEQCMRQLIGRNFRYFGVMGSQAKMKKLMGVLKKDFPQTELDKIYTPIGIPISSKTPEEIALSIAAEMVKVKNSNV